MKTALVDSRRHTNRTHNGLLRRFAVVALLLACSALATAQSTPLRVCLSQSPISTSASCSLGSGVPSGHGLVLLITVPAVGATIPANAITDTRGNSYAQLQSQSYSGNDVGTIFLWYANVASALGAGDTIQLSSLPVSGAWNFSAYDIGPVAAGAPDVGVAFTNANVGTSGVNNPSTGVPGWWTGQTAATTSSDVCVAGMTVNSTFDVSSKSPAPITSYSIDNGFVALDITNFHAQGPGSPSGPNYSGGSLLAMFANVGSGTAAQAHVITTNRPDTAASVMHCFKTAAGSQTPHAYFTGNSCTGTTGCTLNNVGAGNMLIISTHSGDAQTPPSAAATISDSQGEVATFDLMNGAVGLSIWHISPVVHAGTHTISVINFANQFPLVNVVEVAGQASGNPVDGRGFGFLNSGSMATANFTTANPNDFLYAWGRSDNGSDEGDGATGIIVTPTVQYGRANAAGPQSVTLVPRPALPAGGVGILAMGVRGAGTAAAPTNKPQFTGRYCNADAPTCSINGVTAGNMLVISLYWALGSGSDHPTLVDSQTGETITVDRQNDFDGTESLATWHIANVGHSGTHTFSFTGATLQFPHVIVTEFTNQSLTNPVTAAVGATGQSSTLATVNLNTSSGNELIYSWCGSPNGNGTGDGFAAIRTGPTASYRMAAANPGLETASCPLPQSNRWAIQALAINGNSQPLTSISVTPALPSIPKGTTQQFTATGTFADNSTQDLTTSVTWSSDSSAATVSSGGLASGAATGSAHITATSGSISGSTTLTVTAPALVSIAVTPSNSSIQTGNSAQYTATGTYTDGTTQNITGQVTWSSLDSNTASVTSAGLVSGVHTGSTIIRAVLGSVTGSTGITVTASLVSISVTPANPSIAKGLTQQFTATGTYSDNTTQNITNSVVWNSTTSAATIAAGGLATGANVGGTVIQATLGSVVGSTNLTVTAPVLVQIAVTPANPSIANGATLQFTATGTYTDGSSQNLTASVAWSSTNTGVATINATGLATSVAGGNTTIGAVLGAVNGSTSLTVVSSTPGLVGYWKFDEGSGSTSADASGAGHTASLVNNPSWVMGEIGHGVSANGTNNYVTVPAFDLSGTHAITLAAWVNRTYTQAGGHSLFEMSSNYNNSTSGFGVFPDDPGCHGIQAGLKGDVGYSVNCYNAPSSGAWHHLAFVFDKTQTGSNETRFYIDGVLQTATSVVLASDNQNAFGNNPIFMFSRGGANEFTPGTLDEVRVYNRALTLTEVQQLAAAVSLVSLSVTPPSATIPNGQTQQFTATGSYSDGSTSNLTTAVTWTSGTPAVATINASGLATGVTAGSSTITAASGSINSSATLTVTKTLNSITVTPANASMVQGASQQYTATGHYSDGSTLNLTSSVTWQSTSPSVATITTGGLVNAVATGGTNIQATLGAVSGTTPLSVTPTIASIAVTPANPSIPKGMTQQFTATATYSDNSTANITSSVTWGSGTPGVATITTGGLATGVNVGTSTITATLGSSSGSTTLTVGAATLMSISVTPANASIGIGGTQQYTATGSFSDGSSQNLTNSVTWSSDASSVVSINSSGLATGVAAGSTTLHATSGAVSGSTGVSVANGSFPWVSYDMWVDFESNTPGAALSAGQLAASTHGAAGTWDASHSNLMTAQNSGEDIGHAASGDGGQVGLAYNLSVGGESYIQWNLPTQKNSMSFGMWYKTGKPGPWIEGPHFITLFNFGTGNMMRLSDERSSFNNARQIRVSPMDQAVTGINDDTWYWVTVKWVQGGAGSFSVYDTSLNLVGTVNFTDLFNSPAQAILIGNTSGTTEAGETINFDDLVVDYTHAAFPLLPKKP